MDAGGPNHSKRNMVDLVRDGQVIVLKTTVKVAPTRMEIHKGGSGGRSQEWPAIEPLAIVEVGYVEPL